MTEEEIINKIKTTGCFVLHNGYDNETYLSIDKLKAFNIIILDGKSKLKFTKDGYKLSASSISFNNWISNPDPILSMTIWGLEPNYKVFISHKAEDKIKAKLLKDNLISFGISCFVAHEDIEPTREWQVSIEAALETCDCLIALLTPDFHNSNWTDQEIGFAYGQKKIIIPIRIGKDPYGFIAKLQGLIIDLDSEYGKIVRILLKNDFKMVDQFISLVENSLSYQRSNYLATFLPEIEELNDSQVDRLISAFSSNDQINGSMGFLGKKLKDGTSWGKGLKFELKRIKGKEYELTKFK